MQLPKMFFLSSLLPNTHKSYAFSPKSLKLNDPSPQILIALLPKSQASSSCIWHRYNDTEADKVGKVQRTAATWAMQATEPETPVELTPMLDELQWLSLEENRLKPSLTFFYNIHSGTVSLDKDKYRSDPLHD